MEKKPTCDGDDLDLRLVFSEDVLIQILVCLPVKSLLRFKSVCKSMRELIESSFFIDLHTTTTTLNSSSSSDDDKFGSFILQTSQFHNSVKSTEIITLSSEYISRSSSESGDWYWGIDGSWHKCSSSGGNGGDWHWDNTNCGWYWVDDNQVFKVDDDDDDQRVLKLDYSGFPPRCDFIVLGSCNGLICLYHTYPYDLDIYHTYLRDISLWNPATRQIRRLPEPIAVEKGMQKAIDLAAFGFDIETKDYKVLLITYPLPTTFEQLLQGNYGNYLCRVQVYSLSTDSWRVLEGIHSLPGKLMFEHQGLYMNGSCSFIAKNHSNHRGQRRFMISFDFAKEIFTTMEFPEHLDYDHNLFLCCLGGEKMALFTTLRKKSPGLECNNGGCKSNIYTRNCPGCDYYYGQDCDIWVLNEHDSDDDCGFGRSNKESWNKLYSFQIEHIIVDHLIQFRGISNNGKFALVETMDTKGYWRMQLYNLVTKEAKKDFLTRQVMSKVYAYKPSLVSVVGGNGTTTALTRCQKSMSTSRD